MRISFSKRPAILNIAILTLAILFLGASPGLAASIEGKYLLVRDSDGSKPLATAMVSLTFRGTNSGKVSMAAQKPDATVTDSGTFAIKGKGITILFKEMEWEARNQPFNIEACHLILPFKALSGSPGPGTSLWRKDSSPCKEKGSSADPQLTAQMQNIASQLKKNVNAQTKSEQSDKENKDSDIPPGMTVVPINEKESCKNCKYGRCIKELIKQKEAFIKMYTGLSKEFEGYYIEPDKSGKLVSSYTIYKRGIGLDGLKYYNEQFKKYNMRLDNESTQVLEKNQIKACGINASEMSTDSIECKINTAELEKFKRGVPCKDISAIAGEHEIFHFEACSKRKDKDLLITPAGHAKEEVTTHQQELAKLQKLLEEIKKTKKGCWRCGQTKEIFFGASDCNVNCPKVTLANPVFKCFELNEKGESRRGIEKAF